MQRNVWLDNAKNLRQYILRYTVPNLTSLCNVAFHWLTSGYMQLASCSAGRRRCNMYIFTVFLKGKCYKCIRMGIIKFKISFWEVYCWIYVRKSRFMASLTRRRKTKFPTVYPTIYLPKWKCWIQLSPNYYVCKVIEDQKSEATFKRETVIFLRLQLWPWPKLFQT